MPTSCMQIHFAVSRYDTQNVFAKIKQLFHIDPKANFLSSYSLLQWMEISGIKDQAQRQNFCNALFTGGSMEHKCYEAIKFIMLYQVIEAYEYLASNQECIPNFFSDLFRRDTSLDPLSYMMNHLNSIGDRRGLDQVNAKQNLINFGIKKELRRLKLIYFYAVQSKKSSSRLRFCAIFLNHRS